ncbi:outer membrane beta-barrel protein [Flavobacterium sp. GA093]|uniref:Outer membrane beta-barrel protein n=1 Tax=Flavobacterium hydrocarbonoxydans TaxID=2683249 RepID=A0A6I4NLU1_9FLAO|nr:porin family protein [Flavobacterium hydrocarbonoxydans]MWB93862.1 outer membrane beta-barrel protein [Flavobacterium hydrocarbonoxydans]
MKKIIIAAFVFVTGFTNAQVTVSPGIKGGLNISGLTNFERTNSKYDFYAGGFVAIKFNKYFTLQPEILYSRQGVELNIATGSLNNQNDFVYNSRKANYELNYLSLDAVAKFHFNGKGFHVLAGPSFDFKIDDNNDEFYADKPVNFDLGLIAGVGYSLPNGLTFEARFKQGLIDIYGYDYADDENGNGNYDEVFLNQVFQFGISYTFKTK